MLGELVRCICEHMILRELIQDILPTSQLQFYDKFLHGKESRPYTMSRLFYFNFLKKLKCRNDYMSYYDNKLITVSIKIETICVQNKTKLIESISKQWR